MAYFSELPYIQYPSRFENQSSNEDYTLVRNIFRRAKINERIANYATAFNYYYIKDDERPDQIAERIYGDVELDWVVLITNNITNLPSQWPLNNESLYEYLIDKYGDENSLQIPKYYVTNEVRDEYNRLVQPKDLKTDLDFYEEFTTIKKENNPLFYDVNFYPVPSSDYELTITTNLGQYLEVWERGNLEEGEEYDGETYNVSEIFLNETVDPSAYQLQDKLYPEYSRLDYSYLNVYGRNEEIKEIYNPVSLIGWPYSWGGIVWVYNREGGRDIIELKPNLSNPTNITDDFRLYSFSRINKISKIEYTKGTIIESQSNQIYNVSDLSSSNDGIEAKFEVKRNNSGQIIFVNIINGGVNYIENEIITVSGDLIGGQKIIDDIQITVKKLEPMPQFRFVSIGDTLNHPYPGVKMTISNKNKLSYLNTNGNVVSFYPDKNAVTNYEYELEINDNYRKVLLLKPEYLGAFIGEFRDIMKYDKSSETISSNIKKVYNPKINE